MRRGNRGSWQFFGGILLGGRWKYLLTSGLRTEGTMWANGQCTGTQDWENQGGDLATSLYCVVGQNA